MGEVQDGGDRRKSFVAPAIKSIEQYDFARAKICCSLTWLVAKAYGTGTVNLHAFTCTVHVFFYWANARLSSFQFITGASRHKCTI